MKRALLIAGVLLLALGGLLYALTSTETGLRWLAARAGARLPEGSSLGELRGSIRGPIEISNARFTAAGLLIEIGHATIEWSPRALLRRRAHLRRVDASDVRVQRTEAAPRRAAAAPALPLAVLVDALAVRRLDVVTAEGAHPLRLDEVSLAAQLDASGIAVRGLRARGLGAHAQGDLAFASGRTFESSLAWGYAPAGYAPLAGELRAHAQGDVIAVEHTLAPPYNLQFAGVLDPRERRVRGRLAADGLALDALRVGWPRLRIDGTADVDGTLDALAATLDSKLTLAGGTEIPIDAELRADRERLVVTRASAQLGELRAEGAGQASLRDWLAGGKLSDLPIVVDVTALELPVPRLGSVRGQGRIEGSYAQHAIEAEGKVQPPERASGTWKVAARGAGRVLTIDALEVAFADAVARAHGTLEWQASPTIELRADVRDADPGVLWPSVSGRLDATATLVAQPASRSWSLGLETLSGTLRGRSVRGSGGVSYDAGTWHFEALELAAGDARLSLRGELAERATLRWALDAPDLGAVMASAAGRVHASGRIEGTRTQLLLEGVLEAGRFSTGGLAGEAVNARWNVDLSGRTPVQLELAADALVAGGRRFDSVRIDGGGPLRGHAFDVTVVSEKVRAQLALAGGWNGTGWQGQLAQMEVDAAALGRWTLTAPAALAFGRRQLQLERACLHDGTSTSCAHLAWRESGAWSAGASLEDVPLAAFAPFFPPALDYTGRAGGELELGGEGRAITAAQAALAFTPGTIAQREPPRPLLSWQRAQGAAHLVGDRVLVDAGVELGAAGRLIFAAAVPAIAPWHLADAPIEGRVEGVLEEIPLIAALLPDLSELHGKTRLDLRLAGTLSQPAIYGEASFREGAAELPRLGISLRDVAIALRGDGGTLTLDGRARSGEGTLALAGTLAPGTDGWRGRATITGRDFVAVELPDLHAEISPSVQIELDGRDVRIAGEVSLPRARVAPRDLRGAVRESSDAVVFGADARDGGRSPWRIDASVRFALGRDVHFEGYGLDAQVGGSVVATDQPGAATTASGELRVIEGTYTAYGRELELDRGRLLFTGGPIANPALDARAVRKIEQQTVGVDARGTLRKPELKLYSDPSLSQSDALAFLLTGRPVSGLSGGEQIELADATRQVGLSGAGFLASQVGRRIGFDDVGIENAGDATQASFFVGKYLSPKLYVSYGLGLFESFNKLRVRYAFTPQLSLQAESGTEQSADVLYTIER